MESSEEEGARLTFSSDRFPRELDLQKEDKWINVRKRCFFLGAMLAYLSVSSQAIYLPAMPEAQQSLGATDFQISLTIIGPTIILAFGPLFTGPLSDRYGRRISLILALGQFGSLLICAGALNIWFLIFGRTISYIFSCGFNAIGTGIVSDTFPPSKRGSVIGYLLLPSFLGSILLPPISGAIVQLFGWRSSFCLMIIPAFFGVILIYFFLPETVDPTAPKRSLSPISTIKVLTTYPLLGIIFCNGFTFAAMSAASSNFSLILASYYPFGSAVIGLMYMPYGIGLLCGAVFGGKAADKITKARGIGGATGLHIFFALMACGAVVLFGWAVPNYPLVTVIAIMVVSFSAICSRTTVFSTAIHLNPGGAATTTAALICFQFLLSVIELSITGILLGKIIPGIIYSMWAALILLALPFSAIVAVQYWNKQSK